MSQSLHALLESLPEEERFILTLHYLKGIPSKKIAETLGVNQRSVDSVIAAGKSRILAALGIK